MPTALARKIKALILAQGPISVTDYFALCLADPEHGYYRTRNPFGRAGDFVTGFGDTLQAVLNHGFDPPLAHPGEADLTSHVDFASLAATAEAMGLHVHGRLHQGDFLLGLGLAERASALGRNRDAAFQQQIVGDVERLAGAGAGRMGELFKVLAVGSAPLLLSPFRKADAAD